MLYMKHAMRTFVINWRYINKNDLKLTFQPIRMSSLSLMIVSPLQQNSIPLDPGHALQIVPRQRTVDQPITWTGLGLVRVLEGGGLRFTVDNLPSSLDYQLVIRYEPKVRNCRGLCSGPGYGWHH